MRLISLILLFPSLLLAQVTKEVKYYSIGHKIQEPLMFFPTNILAGANISIDLIPPDSPLGGYRIRINGGAGGGTNALILTNGAIVGSIGTLNFIGATGMVSGSDVTIGGFGGGSSIGTSNISIMTNGVIVVSSVTNLNFVEGTNLVPIRATNTSGDVSVGFNVNTFGITNGFVMASITNGLATINYVDNKTNFTTNGNQFGAQVILTIKEGAFLTNIMAWPSNVFGPALIVNSKPGMITNYFEIRNTNNIPVVMMDSNNLFIASNLLSQGYIQQSKVTANRATIYDVNKNLTNSSITDAQLGYLAVAQFTNWGLYSTDMVANVSTNLTKYLSNIWGDVGRVLVPSDGQGLIFDSAMGRWTNKTITASASAAGNSADIQFNEGGVLAGTNKWRYDRTNHVVKLIGALPTISVEDQTLLSTNIMGSATYHTPNSDMTFQTVSSNRWIIKGSGGINPSGHLVPGISNAYDLGGWTTAVRSNYVVKNRVIDRIILGKDADANTGWEITNAVITTNVFWRSVSNPVAGQIEKYHSVTYAGGIAHITLTNDANTSAAAFTTNGNQFGASVTLTIKTGAFLTNLVLFASSADATNEVINQFSGSAGALSSWRNSSGGLLFEVNSNGFLMQANTLTNYNRGGTLTTPTNTIAYGVDNFAGRIVPTWFDDKALQFSIQPALFSSRVMMLLPSGGVNINSWGMSFGTAPGGTVFSHPVVQTEQFILPYMIDVASAATSNSVAGTFFSINQATAGRHDGSGRSSGYFYGCEWATTNNIAGIVGGGAPRLFIGLINSPLPDLTNAVVTTNATDERIGLMADPKQSLNMFISSRDVTAEFRTNTGINLVASNLYQFYMFNSPTSRFVNWKLKDLTARVEANGWFSNNVPTNGLKGAILSKNGTNRAHSIRMSKMYVEAPLAPQ